MNLIELKRESLKLNASCHFWLSQMTFHFEHNGHDYFEKMDLMFERFDKASSEFKKAIKQYDKVTTEYHKEYQKQFTKEISDLSVKYNQLESDISNLREAVANRSTPLGGVDS